ncbi:MAG: putative metallopeptidase [Vicinamibacterales bacterium]
MAKAKKVSVRLLGRDDEFEGPIYGLMDELIEAHHEHLQHARVALAWNMAWKPDADGRVTLGMCKLASDLDKELAPYDFVILLSREFWSDERTTDLQRRALLDHELCHAEAATGDDGEQIVDTRGRRVWRIRKHDIEEFSSIGERYGTWKKDIEHFFAALNRAPEQLTLAEAIERLKEPAEGMRLVSVKVGDGPEVRL